VGVTKCGGVYGVVVSNAREEEGVELRKNGGAHGVVVYSDVSGSSQSTSTGEHNQIKKRDQVPKKHSFCSRPPIPLIGTPMFRKMALVLEASGKLRKEGSSVIITRSPSEDDPAPQEED
jgi:hypothetical protein